MGLGPEGTRLLDLSLPAEVVEIILNSRAASTRKPYALKWKIFTAPCSAHLKDLVNCSVDVVLRFLQEKLSAGLTSSTLKVYVAAVSAYHTSLEGSSVGTGYLAVVLERLSGAPFEPLHTAPDRLLTFKMMFLLANTSLKRVGDLHLPRVSSLLQGWRWVCA